MSLESDRKFEFDDVKVTIREIFSTDISGNISSHGSHLWPAAPVLAAAITRLYPKAIEGDVIELGAGIGLPGMAAGKQIKTINTTTTYFIWLFCLYQFSSQK